MKRYSENWIRFFQSEFAKEVPVEILANVEELVNRTREGHFLLNDDLYNTCRRNLHWFGAITGGLEDAEIIRTEWKCPHCERGFEFSGSMLEKCMNCGEEFSNTRLEDVILVNKSMFDSDKLQTEIYENRAEVLSKRALEWGRIVYLHCDIVSSQIKQLDDKDDYNLFLRKLWKEIWPNALMVASTVYLPLMTKGDASNIAFLDMEDAARVMKKFSTLTKSEKYQFSIFIGELLFEEKDRRGFMKGLDKKWDFNSEWVTQFHRRVYHLASVARQDNKEYNLKICLIGEATNHAETLFKVDLKEQSITPTQYKDKHGNLDQFSYLAYFI